MEVWDDDGDDVDGNHDGRCKATCAPVLLALGLP